VLCREEANTSLIVTGAILYEQIWLLVHYYIVPKLSQVFKMSLYIHIKHTFFEQNSKVCFLSNLDEIKTIFSKIFQFHPAIFELLPFIYFQST
jgi:hypothetical protein